MELYTDRNLATPRRSIASTRRRASCPYWTAIGGRTKVGIILTSKRRQARFQPETCSGNADLSRSLRFQARTLAYANLGGADPCAVPTNGGVLSQ